MPWRRRTRSIVTKCLDQTRNRESAGPRAQSNRRAESGAAPRGIHGTEDASRSKSISFLACILILISFNTKKKKRTQRKTKVFLNSKAERIHRQPAGIPHGTVRMQVLKPESDSAPDSGLRGLSKNHVGDRSTAPRCSELCPQWLSEAKVTTHPRVHDTQVMMRRWPGEVPSSSPGSAQRRRAAVWRHGKETLEQHSKETRLRVQQRRQTRTQKQNSQPEGQQKRR